MRNYHLVSMFFISTVLLNQGCIFKNMSGHNSTNKNAASENISTAQASSTPPSEGSIPVASGSTQASAPIGTVISLLVGELVSLTSPQSPNTELLGTLKLVSQEEDSRCPANVNCMWEGQATVRIHFAPTSGGTGSDFALTLRAGHPELSRRSENGYTFQLVGLDPTPTPQTTQPPRQVAKLVVNKN